MKYFRMSYEEVVFRRSYLNILLLNRSIPSIKFDTDKDGESGGGPKPQKSSKAKVVKKSYSHESELFASLM